MENLLTGAELIRFRKGEEMAPHRPKPCENCGRIKALLHGLCTVCGRVGDLEGQERADALTAIKERIERGEVKTRGRRPKEHEGHVVKPGGPEAKLANIQPQIVFPKYQEIPLTIRLTIDVTVRVNGVTA